VRNDNALLPLHALTGYQREVVEASWPVLHIYFSFALQAAQRLVQHHAAQDITSSYFNYVLT